MSGETSNTSVDEQDPGFWAAVGQPDGSVQYEVDDGIDGVWLHPDEVKDNSKEKPFFSVKHKLEPVPEDEPKSKKKKKNQKKKISSKPEMEVDDSGVKVEDLRDEFESNTEWNMRRAFLNAHMGTLPLNRLICLSKCFINYEIYGNIYPTEVMKLLQTMSLAIANVIPNRNDRLKSKYEVAFVKASYSNPSSTEDELKPKFSNSLNNNKKAPKGMITFVKSGASYESINYAKAEPNDEETEKETYHPGQKPCHKQSEGFGDSNKPEEYDSLYDNMQGRIEIEQKEHKISAFKIALEQLHKNKPDLNWIAKFFEAAQKIKGTPHSDTDISGNGFKCSVFLEKIFIAESTAKSKKVARADAHSLACEKLLKPYHKLTGSHPDKLIFSCSDVPFDSDKLVKALKPEKGTNKNSTLSNTDSKGINKSSTKELKSMKKHLKDFYIRELAENTFDFPLNCLHQTCDFHKIPLEMRNSNWKSGQVKCHLYVNGYICAEGFGEKAKDAEQEAARIAIEKLRDVCWTLKYKSSVDTDTEKLSKDSVMEDKEKITSELEHGKKLGESNIGSKLMKKMGWSGGGIGKDQQGREEPVLVQTVVARSGLGASVRQDDQELNNVVFKIVSDYYNSNDDSDLAFAPDFTNVERKLIHNACRRFNLKSKSYGSGDDRYLVISRQRTPEELYKYVSSKGGETIKYKLIPPRLPEFK